MYRSSAKLTAYLCKKYKIPIDRKHIIEHKEVPGCSSGSGGGVGCHTDPGPNWDWTKYINLVRNYAGNSVYKQIVDNDSSRFRATSDWGTSTWSSQKYGRNYRFIKPESGPGSAKFIVKFPKRGKYDIFAWWPSHSGYNNRARFLIRTVDGWKVKVVNQRHNGGKWNYLGTYDMPAGNGSYVRLAKRSNGSGYIIADAVLIRER
jgi:hypothetical protein